MARYLLRRSLILSRTQIEEVLTNPVVPCRFINLRRRRNFLLNEEVEDHRTSSLAWDQEKPEPIPQESVTVPRDFRFVNPEFLPKPDANHRDRIKEKLERTDMYQRRAVMEIPEFYVGSVLAVTVADSLAPTNQNRFVGICINRGGYGLRANFTLRNVVDGQGVEIRYEMYSPVLQKIEVLKLEKRLDAELYYLRDAPQEYSTFPFDMEPIPMPKGTSVPVNPLKVKLNPRPWHERWERFDLKGVEDLDLPERFYKRASEVAKPWEKYDLMKHYRESINEEETEEIVEEVYRKKLEMDKQKGKVTAQFTKDRKR